MFLRSLAIRGFKSFAEKTVLEFAPGTSVIVGPNGSGKSNLADAIAWVLGEQGPRALRGSQMADVIFAGSPARPALGMAEVTLVIDNEAGLIPVPDAEIEVGRVVYRSGESQYLIGGKPARLMDIQELLSDTGIGRALHTVVGQGQLEDVLVARPEERRQFIEEAAGIAKHRRRKERAQRKLQSLDQDLLRLQDVMAELKRQLRPLRQQAEAAGKYETLGSEAAELAWRLAAARLRALTTERDSGMPAWEEGRRRRGHAEARLGELDTEIASLTERLADAERRLAEAEAEEEAAARARLDAEASLREAVRAEGEARARLAEEAGRTGRLFTLEEEAGRAEAELGKLIESLRSKEAELGDAERAYEAAERSRRAAEEARRDARDRVSARRAELQTFRRSLDLSRTERDRLMASLDEVRTREEATRTERDALEEEIERLDARSTPASDRLARLQRDQDRLTAEAHELERRERGLEARRHGLQARRAALAETPGRRFLSRRRGRALGLLSELVRIDPGFDRAVAAALGALADAVVYVDHGAAVEDASEAGGATMAVADEHRGRGFVVPGERTLLSVVHADPRASPAVAAALRHVYLATDRDDALARHRRNPGASFVTPDGVLVGPAVVRTAPAPTEEELTVRRQEVTADRDLTRVNRELTGKRQALAKLHAERASVEEFLRRTDALITAAADRLARLDGDVAALRREGEILEHRLAGVEEDLGSATLALEDPERSLEADAEAEADLPPVAEPPIALRVEVEALRRERGRLESLVSAHRDEARRLRDHDPAALATVLERASTVRVEAEAALHRSEERAESSSTARDEASSAVAAIRTSEAEANRAWREAAALLQSLRDEYEEQEQFRRDVDRRIAEAERVLHEGHGRDPAEALSALTEEDTIEGIQRRSDLVARRMTLLGRVNLVAADEYHQLQERHDFMQREIDDVKAARRDLHRVVRDVDTKVEEIFAAAFTDVAGEFEALFGQLFPGGEGKLTLTDPADLLGTGIEIEARPGRKRVKRLSLLSGGERALTALGFLFAIFRARPSPFYLLDEVEAALDDVNLHRFLELIRGFAGTSQVILVSHQKRTMEAADVLYGVSMDRDGASRVVAQRVSEAMPEAAGPRTARV
jgi:chromosome segregation protein